MEIDEYLKKMFKGYPRLMKEMGVESFIPLMPTDDFNGGLCLEVETEDFKGEIRIELSFFDLFDVSLYDFNEPDNTKPIMQVNRVHVDGLVGVAYELFKRASITSKIVKEGLFDTKITNLLTEELKKSDIIDIIKKDKDFENRVKDIVRDIVKDMYRILYQHNGIFTALGKS